jgi:tagatose-6-phosphate ketose/aldose isomerase
VSFGRSGNSAETIGLLDALDALAPDAPRLNITCNAGGALATRPSPGPQRVVILPPETHDAGFAMTSSFTTMLLTALAIFHPAGAAPLPGLAIALRRLLPVYAAATGPVPERVVFVGTGPLAQAARECALKVMELTAGQVPALWDSSLGFRHGPKSFVRGDTRIVVLTHPDAHPARYDADLVAELRAQFPAARVTSVGPGGDIDTGTQDAGHAAALMVPLAQIMAVTWSAALGLNVDDPFAGQGTLSRVVTGVRLYPVTP